MSLWRKLRLYICVCLLVALAVVAQTRGLGWRLGGTPASIRGPYQTEEGWIVGETVNDILEMSSYHAGQTLRGGERKIPQTIGPGIYRVGAGVAGPAAVDVDVQHSD